MAKFKQEQMNVSTFITDVKDKPANERLGWPAIIDGEYDFDHPLQRRDKQWKPLQRSELIETMVLDIVPIPPIIAIEEKQDWGRNKLTNKKVILDGKQRLTTIRDYVNDKFALYKTIKPVEIDGELYEVAGKKFSELDEEVQSLILKCGLVVYSCPKDNITRKEEKEIFRRLNNGKQLTNAQKNSVYLDEDLARRIFDILTSSVEYTSIEELKKAKKRGRPSKAETEEVVEAAEEAAPEYVTVEDEINFWGDVAVVGGSAVKNGEDKNLVLQCAMLISGYDGGFKDTDIKSYLQEKELDDEAEDSVRNQELLNEREDVYGKLQQAVETLCKGILERRGINKKGKKIVPEQNFKKVNIAPIINGMHLAIEQGKEDLYINRLIKFFDGYADNKEYSGYVDSGTADGTKVTGRRDYFKKMVEQEATDEERAEVEKVQAERQARADRIAEVKIQEAERQAEAERLAKEEKKKSKTPKTSGKGRGRSKKEDKPEEKVEGTEDAEAGTEEKAEAVEGEGTEDAEAGTEVKADEKTEVVEADKPAKPKRNRSKKKAKKEAVKEDQEQQEQTAQEGNQEGQEVAQEGNQEMAESTEEPAQESNQEGQEVTENIEEQPVQEV